VRVADGAGAEEDAWVDPCPHPTSRPTRRPPRISSPASSLSPQETDHVGLGTCRFVVYGTVASWVGIGVSILLMVTGSESDVAVIGLLLFVASIVLLIATGLTAQYALVASGNSDTWCASQMPVVGGLVLFFAYVEELPLARERERERGDDA
jgi:hypothetical protein